MPWQLLEKPSQRKIGIGGRSTYIISDIYSQSNERKNGMHFEILSNFTDKTLEGEFMNEELSRFLVMTNFTEGNGSGHQYWSGVVGNMSGTCQEHMSGTLYILKGTT